MLALLWTIWNYYEKRLDKIDQEQETIQLTETHTLMIEIDEIVFIERWCFVFLGIGEFILKLPIWNIPA